MTKYFLYYIVNLYKKKKIILPRRRSFDPHGGMQKSENEVRRLDKKEKVALSRRELDVMNVLWAAGEPLIASDVPERKPSLSINTVQAVLRKLLAVGLVKVDGIVHSGTVLTRRYSPAITPEEYAAKYVTEEIYPFGRLASVSGLLNALFEMEYEGELIEELEAFLKEKKAESGKGDEPL